MSESILSSCTSGGCGAKIGAGDLSALLGSLPKSPDPNLLVGWDGSDDAAVYRLGGGQCIATTVDFFSPMVDDPQTFGRIAAANALSDVYAMGGRPITALNLVCFPEKLDLSLLSEILRGGADKISEASASLAGGHSIYDREIKYGLSVTGLVSEERILRNNTPRVGDALILTKPLGVGILLAAHRAGIAEEGEVAQAIRSMERLNRYAAEKLPPYDVSACTDITGFGLLAHMHEMAGEQCSLLLQSASVPHFPSARAYADDYILTAAGQRNRNHLSGRCAVDHLPFAMQELLFDPQTSGGLLIAVRQDQSGDLLAAIRRDDPGAAILGTVLPRGKHAVFATQCG